jgi:hypothetical protein
MTLLLAVLLDANCVQAFQGSVDAYLSPSTRTVSVGEVFTAKVMVNSGDSKISGVLLRLNTDESKLKIKSVVVNTGVFGMVPLESVANGVASMAGVNTKTSADLASGTIEFATVTFEGVANGTVDVNLNSGWEVVGPTTTSDPNFSVNWQKGTYTVADAVTGQDLVLNYKFAFSNVNPTSAQCVVDWPLKITILGSNQNKVYEGVVPQSKTVEGNKLVFGGSLGLVGFTETSNIAVFASGPKQLQMKYGIGDQSAYYGKVGGELTLTKTTSLVYDFSNYPMLAGDVVSNSLTETQDGFINGVDFAFVKAKSLTHETVDAGGYLKGDLDGNCQVNSNDVNILKMSLQEKQDELY